MNNANYIYKVNFHIAPEGYAESEFYFGSISAIYEMFCREQIGCRDQRLYDFKVSEGKVYVNKICSISRHPLYRKAKKSGRKKKLTETAL